MRAGYEVLLKMLMKFQMFWIMKPCMFIKSYVLEEVAAQVLGP